MKEEKTKKEMMIIRETFVQSFMNDIVSFGFLLGVFYLNYEYLGNTWYIGLFVGFMAIAFASKIFWGGRWTVRTKKEATEKINSYWI